MTYDLTDRLVVAVDLDGVADKAGLMDRCARALALPDWFGRNWDALADSLSDHTVWPEGAVERGLLIVVDAGGGVRAGPARRVGDRTGGVRRGGRPDAVADGGPGPWRILRTGLRPARMIRPEMAFRATWDNEARALPPG